METDAEQLKHRTLLAAKINDYYRCLPETKPGGEGQKKPPAWSSADKEEELQGEYERIRGLLNGKANKVMIQKLFVRVMGVAETITLPAEKKGFGINPLEWDLEGLGTACAANIKEFEPELTEASIELRDWLASSWEMRLAYKAVLFMQTYHQLKSNPELLEQIRRAQAAAQAAAAAQDPNAGAADL